MGLTVLDVLHQTRSQFLQPGGVNQETFDEQSGAVTSGATSMTTDGLASYIAEGSIVEWDDNTMEAALVRSSAGAVVTFQERGYLDTAPAAHADGTRVIVDPVYLKKVLYDALRQVISLMNGAGLYAIRPATGLTYQTSTLVTLPQGTTGIAGDVYVANGTTYNVLTSQSFRYLGGFTPPKVQFLGGGIVGAALTMNVKRDYLQPSDVALGVGQTVLDVDLDNCFIPQSLQMHLPMGIAAQVLAGRDIPSVDSELVRRTQNNAGVPVGTRVNLGRTLWTQFLSGPVNAERNHLLGQSPVTISHERY